MKGEGKGWMAVRGVKYNIIVRERRVMEGGRGE